MLLHQHHSWARILWLSCARQTISRVKLLVTWLPHLHSHSHLYVEKHETYILIMDVFHLFITSFIHSVTTGKIVYNVTYFFYIKYNVCVSMSMYYVCLTDSVSFFKLIDVMLSEEGGCHVCCMNKRNISTNIPLDLFFERLFSENRFGTIFNLIFEQHVNRK